MFRVLPLIFCLWATVAAASPAVIAQKNYITNNYTYLTDTGGDYLVDDSGVFLVEGGETFPPMITNIRRTVLETGTVDGRDWHGRASTQQLANGNWVLVFRSAPGHADNGDDVLQIRFSSNHTSWTANNTKLGGGAVTGFPMTPTGGGTGDLEGPGEPQLYLAPNDSLILHMWNADYSVTCDGSWQSISSDGGETWGATSLIDFTGIAGDSTIFSTDDYFTLGSDIYIGVRKYEDCTFAAAYNFLAKSSDNGTSWAFVSDMSASDYTENTIEVGFEYTGNNNIVAVLRTGDGTATYKTTSTNLGTSFAALTDVTATPLSLSGRHRIYSFAHLKGEATWWTDQTLIATGFEDMTPGDLTDRVNSVWVSEDGGTNWYGPFWLDKEFSDGGYGDILYDSINDDFVMVSYAGTSAAADLVEYRFKIKGIRRQYQ